MKKDLKQITVETLPNGYSLEIEGEQFMYHSVERLIKGIAVHLGLLIEEPLPHEYADNLIKCLKDGYILSKIRQENARLKRELKQLRKESKKQLINKQSDGRNLY